MIPEMSGSYSVLLSSTVLFPQGCPHDHSQEADIQPVSVSLRPRRSGVISGVLLSVLPNTMKMIIFALWLIVHKQYQQSHPPKPMAKLVVKDTTIRTLAKNGIDYICITDIARQKNPDEPKDVVKNWMRDKKYP